MKEIWKLIKDFNNYEISNLGRVKSLNYNNTGRCKLLKLTPGKHYLQLTICKNGTKYGKRVHQLVAEAFIPNPDNLPEVNHKNGNKADNTINNLEWVTNQQNIDHAWKTGLSKRTIQSHKTISSKSQFVGVSWDTSRNKWYSCIRFNSKTISLGRYNDELAARDAYIKALNKLPK